MVYLSAFRENLVDNDGERRSGVDYETTLRNLLFRCMQSHNQLPFARSSAKLVFWSPDGLIIGFLGLGDGKFGHRSGSFRPCDDQLCLKGSGVIGVLFR
ncbi:hypothetical protein, partial [Rhizobium favelukesii]|uniref:hypothetical protein n=1 Tax=Rhizobium favelukesii TaxID=348824 RepID=UPI0035A71F31